MLTDADLPLFAPRPAAKPSETPEKFTAAANPKPRDYAKKWRTWVDANPHAASVIRDRAYLLLMDGAERIEVNKIFADVRAELRVSLNHSLRAACADWLIAQEPRLAGVIERRRRTTATAGERP